MRRDPRVLRWTVLKLADKIEDLAKKGEKTLLSDKPTAHEVID